MQDSPEKVTTALSRVPFSPFPHPEHKPNHVRRLGLRRLQLKYEMVPDAWLDALPAWSVGEETSGCGEFFV
ncbi:hypothetical protein EK904_001566 [Melospiza melodia maxima]|nr:hypothetical protein EK904_001566 [Melospiza melodia maxima]